MAELQGEVALLRAKCDSHPEVKRFAVENLRLGEVGRCCSIRALPALLAWVCSWLL